MRKWKVVFQNDKSQRFGPSKGKDQSTSTKNVYTPRRKHKKNDSSAASISQIAPKFPHSPVLAEKTNLKPRASEQVPAFNFHPQRFSRNFNSNSR